MSAEFQHWSEKWEEDVAAVLQEQGGIQASIDTSMRRGDLAEAGYASLEHVWTSFALGDTKEGAAYLSIGIMLSQAGKFTLPEEYREQSTHFEIPPVFTPFVRDSEDTVDRIDAVHAAVIEVEGLINTDQQVSPLAKNTAINEAVTAIVSFYILDKNSISYNNTMNEQVLRLARQLAEHTELEPDAPNLNMACETYTLLMLLAQYTQYDTRQAFNLASNGFKEIIKSTSDEELFRKCFMNIQEIADNRFALSIFNRIFNSSFGDQKNVKADMHIGAIPSRNIDSRSSQVMRRAAELRFRIGWDRKAYIDEKSTGDLSSDEEIF